MVLGVPQRVAIIDVAVVGGMSLVYVALEELDVPKRWSFVVVGCSAPPARSRASTSWLIAGSHTVLAALAYPLVLGALPLSRL